MNNLPHLLDWLSVLFASTYPALLTWVYFVLLAGNSKSLQQAAYGIGKTVQFALPLIWIGLLCREPLYLPSFDASGLAIGMAFGLVVSATMWALYFAWLKPTGIFAAAGKKMLSRLSDIGIKNMALYIVVALFYSLLHSLLEEYYWRWFVFGRMQNLMPLALAISISSLAFMAHHVIVLSLYFGTANPWTWFFSAATAFGGAVWALLYWRSGSIYGPWASHLIVDAAIFGIGYDLIRAAAQP